MRESEYDYIVKMVKYAIDMAYRRGEAGVYSRVKQILAIRGVSEEQFAEMEEMYYYGILH
jgi:hypothetical protein